MCAYPLSVTLAEARGFGFAGCLALVNPYSVRMSLVLAQNRGFTNSLVAFCNPPSPYATASLDMNFIAMVFDSLLGSHFGHILSGLVCR